MLERHEFDDLIAEHYPAMYRLAYRLVNHYDDAEEIVQEAFLKAWSHRRRFRRESSFKTWIYRIVLNTSISFKRKMRRHRRKLAAYFTEAGLRRNDPRRGMERHIHRLELNRRLNEALQRLPDSLRALVVLRDLELLPYEDIAVILNIPVGTVKSRLWRARTLLRRELERMGVRPEGTPAKNHADPEAASAGTIPPPGPGG